MTVLPFLPSTAFLTTSISLYDLLACLQMTVKTAGKISGTTFPQLLVTTPLPY